MYCSKCGTVLYEEDNFCVSCGTPVKPREEVPSGSPVLNGQSGAVAGVPEEQRSHPRPGDEPSETDLSLFVGAKAEDYLRKWKEGSHWNWPAFLLGGYWMLYRGMYLYLLLYLICLTFMVNIVRFALFPVYAVPDGVAVVAIIAQLALHALFAAFANQIYLHHARRKIRALNLRFIRDPETRAEKIALAGETSLYIPIALAVLPALILAVTVLFYSFHTYKEINETVRDQQLQQRLQQQLQQQQQEYQDTQDNDGFGEPFYP
ncbi:zinc ribbon domain-containing protein [Paenibacillus sp. M1]|uniref:Zinc ribbon domain-containing protein n=1 Tax=Paenibacillus haidiansis TaxID=1574488 RepID=A0ABU7VT26_9BACL